jgi:hypothetical protein
MLKNNREHPDENSDTADPSIGRFFLENFLFTTFDQLTNKNILTEPIWIQPGSNQSLALFVYTIGLTLP